MRSCVWMIAVLAFAPLGVVQAQAPSLEGACTAVHQIGPANENALEPGDEAESKVQTFVNHRAAFYLSSTRGKEIFAELSAYLYPETQFELVRGPRRVLQLSQGSLVLDFIAQDQQPLAVIVGNSWARLDRGMLRVTLGEGQPATFSLASQGGSATLFDGPLPEGDLSQAQGGKPIPASPDASKESRTLITNLNAQAADPMALAWIKNSEGGELVPSDEPGVVNQLASDASSTQLAAASETSSISTSLVGQRTSSGQIIVPLTLSTGTPLGSVLSSTQARLTSGNPASVLVAGRETAAPVVGTGTAGTSALGTLLANPLLRPPLGLSQP